MKRTHRQSKDRSGWKLISGVVAVSLTLLVLTSIIKEPPRDSSNCKIGTSVPRSTVLLFDQSDGVSLQALSEIRNRAQKIIRDSTNIDERISIYSLSGTSRDSLTPLLSLCKPPATGNRWYQNVNNIEKKFDSLYLKPVMIALERIPTNSPTSPITAVLNDLSDMEVLKAPKNRLLIFSDMLEHTEDFSLYACPDTSAVVGRFRQTRSGARERPVYRNTEIVLHLIPRLSMPTRNMICRDKLWLWFFGEMQGTDSKLTVNPLPAGSTLPRVPRT